MAAKPDVKTMLRLPADLHERLVREAGGRTAKVGQRVSLNALVLEILRRHVERRG